MLPTTVATLGTVRGNSREESSPLPYGEMNDWFKSSDREAFEGWIRLKTELDAKLCGKRNSDGGSRSKKIVQSACRHTQLLVARDRRGLRTRWPIQAKGCGIRQAVHSSGERRDIADVVVAWILAVE